MHTKILPSVNVLPFLLCALIASSPALAGFQWVPPESLEQALPPTPAQTLYANPAPTPAQIPAPAPQIIEAPDFAPVEPAHRASFDAPPPPSTLGQISASQEKAVRGFANNVPLSVAMRQVLPEEYGFSVAQDVSLGTLVSWKGGASWRQVAKDMLLPAGLTIQEQGQMVHVVPATEAQIASGGGRVPVPMKMKETHVSKASFEPIDEGRPMSLVPPPGAVRASDPLPARDIEGGGSRSMGYLSPPTDMPAPSVARGGGGYASSGTFDSWTADRGEMLRKVLENWGRRAGVEISWQAEYDFPLQASVTLNGSFEEAVRSLLVGFENAKPQPIGQLHNNPTAGHAVLVVQTRGNNYNE